MASRPNTHAARGAGIRLRRQRQQSRSPRPNPSAARARALCIEPVLEPCRLSLKEGAKLPASISLLSLPLFSFFFFLLLHQRRRPRTTPRLGDRDRAQRTHITA